MRNINCEKGINRESDSQMDKKLLNLEQYKLQKVKLSFIAYKCK